LFLYFSIVGQTEPQCSYNLCSY